jgi:parvulin-like peptidyl-prolyl isomerase
MGTGTPSLARRIARDPLLHFAVAGSLLFAAWSAFSPEAAAPADPMRIELTVDDLRQIALVQLSQGRAMPEADELQALAEQAVMQEILAREAVALGLDRDDEIIERRLAQKMDFLLADLARLEPPARDELETWYATNAAAFTFPPRASFRHLYFSPDRRGGEGARDAAAAALTEVASLPGDAPDLPRLADRFMFSDYYGGRTPEDVAKEFGPAFAAGLFAVEPGAWAGPIRSGYGWHLVHVDRLEPARVPALDEIEADVRAAWTGERYSEIRQRAADEMRARYTVVIPTVDPAELRIVAPQRETAADLVR